MDALTFIVEMTKAAAWPLAAIAVALIFRRQLSSLLQAIKKGKLGPAEFEFERGVQEVERLAVELPLPPAINDTRLEAFANPRRAILEAWLELENRAINLATKRGIAPPQVLRHANAYLQAIRAVGLLSPEHLEALKDLQALRNVAAHAADFEPGPAAVLGYVQLAKRLGQEMDRLANQGPLPEVPQPK